MAGWRRRRPGPSLGRWVTSVAALQASLLYCFLEKDCIDQNPALSLTAEGRWSTHSFFWESLHPCSLCWPLVVPNVHQYYISFYIVIVAFDMATYTEKKKDLCFICCNLRQQCLDKRTEGNICAPDQKPKCLKSSHVYRCSQLGDVCQEMGWFMFDWYFWHSGIWIFLASSNNSINVDLSKDVF